MTYFPCSPVAVGLVPFPITGEAVALILLGLLLLSAAGIALEADRSGSAGEVHEAAKKIKSGVQQGIGQLAAGWRRSPRPHERLPPPVQAQGFFPIRRASGTGDQSHRSDPHRAVRDVQQMLARDFQIGAV